MEGSQLSEWSVVSEWMGETIVGRCITTQIVANVQVVAPVMVVVDLMVVRLWVMGLWVVVGIGMVRFRMVEGLGVVVGAVMDWFRVVDWQRWWGSIVDDVVNRRKNMRLVVPVTSKAMA